MYKAKKEIIRKYYKYTYEDWTQPIPNSDTYNDFIFTGNSRNSDGNCTYYQALNPSHAKGWQTNGTQKGWWNMQMPLTIVIYGLSMTTIAGGRFYTDETKTVPIGNAVATDDTVVTGIPTTGIETNNLYFDKTVGNVWAGIKNLKINAKIRHIVEATSSDYDFYRDEQVWSMPKITETGQTKHYTIRS